MIKVRSVDPETVDLPDINDRVYYGQEKIFSESQYARSQDIKKEIKKGRLIVTARSDETFSDYKVPESVTVVHETVKEVAVPVSVGPGPDLIQELKALLNENLGALSSKVNDLESRMSAKQAESRVPEVSGFPPDLVDRLLVALNNQQSGSKLGQDDAHLSEIKKGLDTLTERIGTLGTLPGSKAEELTDENINKRMEEIYVPNVTVTDAKNNVNLELRVVEHKDSLQDSLDKLKKLKTSK